MYRINIKTYGSGYGDATKNKIKTVNNKQLKKGSGSMCNFKNIQFDTEPAFLSINNTNVRERYTDTILTVSSVTSALYFVLGAWFVLANWSFKNLAIALVVVCVAAAITYILIALVAEKQYEKNPDAFPLYIWMNGCKHIGACVRNGELRIVGTKKDKDFDISVADMVRGLHSQKLFLNIEVEDRRDNKKDLSEKEMLLNIRTALSPNLVFEVKEAAVN